MPDILSPYGVPPVGYPNMLDSVSKSSVTKPGTTPDWKRADGTQKGMGFLGALKFKDPKTGKTGTSTELSIGVNINGKEVEIPSLVPTLSPDEIKHLLNGGEPTPEIIKKAVDHATERMKAGKSPFAGEGDTPQAPAAETPQ